MNGGVERVLDASALLAFIHEEPGGAAVEELLDGAAISAVNWSEVLQKLRARGADFEGVRQDVAALGIPVVAFDAAQADTTASLWASTREMGLSLADRACLTLALRLGALVVTAERSWSDLDIGVRIRVIR